ncbi:MAG: hypothetical protein JNM17_27140 [Archangium sp.]|nr:hypothetical protein [Archangium sp.]
MNRFILVACVAICSLIGCKKDEATPTAAPSTPTAAVPAKPAEPAKPSGTQVADFPVQIEMPANAVANDPMGSPGFHSEDGSISVLIAKQTPESAKDIDASKKSIEEFAFKKWIKSEKTADGWLLTWTGMGIDMDGKEYDTTAFEIVKKIGEDSWRCSGSVKKAADLDANVKLCNSMKAN